MSGTDGLQRDLTHVDLKTDIPHSARIYDYMLGGKDNFVADRVAAEEIVLHLPNLRPSMRANRRFLARVARYMAADLGLRQFLDIGTGLPTQPNLHEVVQAVDPTSRVVYVDNDPIVLVHARALLTSTLEGRAGYVDADLRDPDSILRDPHLTDTLDLAQPVGLSLVAILQLIQGGDEARAVVRRLMSALAPGSALALSIVAADTSQRDQVERGVTAYGDHGMPSRAWTKAELEELLGEFELVDPGVVLVHRWHPDELEQNVRDEQVYMYGALAVKR